MVNGAYNDQGVAQTLHVLYKSFVLIHLDRSIVVHLDIKEMQLMKPFVLVCPPCSPR